MKNACMNCTERYIGCHAECEKYKEFADKCDKVRKARAEFHKDSSRSVSFIRESLNKARRRKR